jgi:hypothetical protein
MPDRAWKQRERDVARFMGSEGRTPLSGINSKHTGADCLDDTFFIEVKLRAKHSCITLLRKVQTATYKETRSMGKFPKIPVVALCEGHKSGFGILIDAEDAEHFAVAFLRRLGYTISKRGGKRAVIR